VHQILYINGVVVGGPMLATLYRVVAMLASADGGVAEIEALTLYYKDKPDSAIQRDIDFDILMIQSISSRSEGRPMNSSSSEANASDAREEAPYRKHRDLLRAVLKRRQAA
jgi:hypothetical protein